ncbi:MAG: HAD-IA family hydrolase [Candidatus Eisenbacteria sp.]|nr:HAD-IA family hydrolase [Candidatus Eisenbacteria bacterium]
MIRAVVFDLDNTITDFMKMKGEAVKAAVEAMLDAGLDLPREVAERKLYDIYELEGIEYQKVFDRFLQEELGGIDHRILAAGIVGYRRAREAALVPYPHVNATLIELAKRGIKLAVVSDAPAPQAWLRLCYLRLHQIFDFVITIDDTGKQKPDPAPFECALRLLGVEPGEVLMVGDWPERDMAGAAKVGMKTVFARYGDTFGTLSSGADYEMDDIAELLEIVERENQNQIKTQDAEHK